MTASCFEPRCEFFVRYTCTLKRRLSCMVCCCFFVCAFEAAIFCTYTVHTVVSVHVHVCTLIYSLYICIDAAMLAVVVVVRCQFLYACMSNIASKMHFVIITITVLPVEKLVQVHVHVRQFVSPSSPITNYQ